ncbi:nucleoside recognition domain-containing protein [Cohnella yongneupensis]|uniref:Nucleoside recognition domain-containing protein n=1 Tax=Cohnella yongneupensis TaxID=425006 RepID=A0ABW0R5Z3_9BACL
MDKPTHRRRFAAISVLMGAAAFLVVAGIVYSPGDAFRASLSGLQIWWQNVFPGLLPPLMLADLLAASGLLHGLATLAEPLTRGLFRLPGTSGWAIAFGWSAGIPAGAKEAARLKERGMLQDGDVDTVLLVSHLPNPFLVILVIGCGFLHSAALGWSIALGLWLSAILSGMLWARIAKPRSPKLPSSPVREPRALLRRAFRAAADARHDDGRPFGKQLADSVSHTIATLMAIGGLMMMSAVVIRLITYWIPGSDLWIALPGLYEMHLGAYESSRSELFEAAPVYAAALLSAALAWSGWSGLLQARAAFGAASKFPWARVIAGRLLHGATALLITYPIALAATSKPVADFMYTLWPNRWPALDAWASSAPWPNGWQRIPDTLAVAFVSFGIFILLALTAALIRPKRPRERDE